MLQVWTLVQGHGQGLCAGAVAGSAAGANPSSACRGTRLSEQLVQSIEGEYHLGVYLNC